MKIYLIRGSAGEYDMYHEWIVKAFRSKKRAEAFIEQLNKDEREAKKGDPDYDISVYEILEMEME